MTFLLAFWKPIALGIVLVLLAVAVGVEKHRYDERRRDEGRAQIQAKWDADKAARIQAVTDQVSRWDAERQKYDKAQQELSNERSLRAALAANAARSLPRTVADTAFPAAAAGVLNDAIHASDTASTPGPSAEPAKEAATSPAAADSTVGAVTEWAVGCVAAYEEARGMVAGWQDFYASLQKAQPQ